MSKDYWLLWQGQLISQFGTHAFNIARIYWLVEVVKSGSVVGALLMMCSFVFTFIGPIGGYLADRYLRKYIIILSDLASGVAMLLLALIIYIDINVIEWQVFSLFFVSALISASSGIFSPTIRASIPNIVNEDNLKSANSLFAMTTQLAQIVGQGAGGILLVLLGAPLMFLINGVSFIFSAISELFIRFNQPTPENSVSKGRRFSISEVIMSSKTGISEIYQKKSLGIVITYKTVDSFLLMPIFVVTPYYANEVFSGDASLYGYFIGMFSIGMVLGYVAIPMIHKIISSILHERIILASLIFRPISMLVVGFSSNVYTALGGFLLLGLSISILHVEIETLIQKSIDNNKLGRVFGVASTLENIFVPFSFLTAGLLVDLIDNSGSIVLILSGFVSILISGIFFLSRKHSNMNLYEITTSPVKSARD